MTHMKKLTLILLLSFLSAAALLAQENKAPEGYYI